MSDLLEAGGTYVRREMSPSDWRSYVTELRDGDRVEVRRGGVNMQGRRQTFRAHLVRQILS